MKIEKIITESIGRCINVSANKVESLRINNETESTVRYYDGGFIGVEGKKGAADFSELQASAQEKLAQKIPYPETHGNAEIKHIDTSAEILRESEFVGKSRLLIEKLAEENPQFIFSNKILLNSMNKSYENSDGTKYTYKGSNFECGLAFKFKGSANIMDEFYGTESNIYDEKLIAADIKMQCDAFLKNLPQLKEDEVTVISDLSPLHYIINYFVAELYCNNASLLSGKLGQKVFSDKLGIILDRNPARQLNLPFFDAEGVVNQDCLAHLVKNGVVNGLLTTKNTAAMFGLENIGSASGTYSSVPSVGVGGFDAETTCANLTELIGNGKAVYLSVTSGGDVTPSGDMSMPSQVSYVYEKGHLTGKLPEFTVSGNVFDIFGKNFLGVAEKGLFGFGKRKYLVFRAKLVNKSE